MKFEKNISSTITIFLTVADITKTWISETLLTCSPHIFVHG